MRLHSTKWRVILFIDCQHMNRLVFTKLESFEWMHRDRAIRKWSAMLSSDITYFKQAPFTGCPKSLTISVVLLRNPFCPLEYIISFIDKSVRGLAFAPLPWNDLTDFQVY